MRPQSVTVSSQTTSAAVPMDHQCNPFSVGVACVVSAGGTLTYKVQHTFDDIQDSTITPTWFDHETILAKTASDDGNYAFPVRAIRLNVTAYTNGNVKMTLLQARSN
jgi:hypothetical protein